MNYFACKKTLTGLLGTALLFGCNQPIEPTSVTPTPKPTETTAEVPTEPAESASAEAGNSTNAAIVLNDELSEVRPVPDQDDLAIRLEMAGIEDPQEAKDFLAAMRTAATENDKEVIANLVHYPFTIYEAGVPQTEYASPAEFLTDFDEIVTDGVITAMKNASYEDLFVNYQGAMIGNGAVWFMKYDEGVRVKAINSF